jgi:Arc/MetJ-type ribon-helix-helix transcriptional regulator
MCCTAACVGDGGALDIDGILQMVRQKLAEHGIDFDACCSGEVDQAEGSGAEGAAEKGGTATKPAVKVVCVAPTIQASAREMGRSARDQVVMVRVDSQTASGLDAWVETGAVKSRSEAAALFIREGMKVRASELERLREALANVHEARERLRREAREVFGMDEIEPRANQADDAEH